mmetsp:Transcript_24103/g.75552  ORF Transcript_24103/g.75552 Transcript_24103/m.75552 type:complete len:335 (+) Transcript_24103:718-1722(+)
MAAPCPQRCTDASSRIAAKYRARSSCSPRSSTFPRLLPLAPLPMARSRLWKEASPPARSVASESSGSARYRASAGVAAGPSHERRARRRDSTRPWRPASAKDARRRRVARRTATTASTSAASTAACLLMPASTTVSIAPAMKLPASASRLTVEPRTSPPVTEAPTRREDVSMARSSAELSSSPELLASVLREPEAVLIELVVSVVSCVEPLVVLSRSARTLFFTSRRASDSDSACLSPRRECSARSLRRASAVSSTTSQSALLRRLPMPEARPMDASTSPCCSLSIEPVLSSLAKATVAAPHATRTGLTVMLVDTGSFVSAPSWSRAKSINVTL